MGYQYVVDINHNDELPVVIRKCNENFRAILAQRSKISQLEQKDAAAAVVGQIAILSEDFTDALASEANIREAADDDLQEQIDDIIISGGGGDTTPTGTISMFAGSTAPTGYLLCQGQAVSRTTYSALFAVIGTTYGSGDGSTTFNLPNLQGRFALGKSSSHALASTGGAETVTLSTNEIPAHTHGSKSITGKVGQVIVPNSDISHTSDTLYFERIDDVDYPSDASVNNCRRRIIHLNATHEHTSVGGGAAHNNMPPYLAMSYIIKF